MMERNTFERELEDLGLYDSIRQKEISFENQGSEINWEFESPITTTVDPCIIPENEKPIEPVMGVYQAPLFSKDAYWPLVSSEKPIVAYRKRGGGSSPGVGPYGRQFMALRQRYDKDNKYLGEGYHAAIDLYANDKDLVVSIEDGEIMRFVYFYLGTWGIVVKHKNVTAIYGEVDRESLFFAGLQKKVGPFNATPSKPPIKVKAGQIIGRIVKNTSKKRSAMLHMEIFDNNHKRNVPWIKGMPNPHKGVYDPSLALLTLARCGKRATGVVSDSLPSSSSSPMQGANFTETVQKNRSFSSKLGWEKYQDKIKLLLGFTDRSPSEELFADAVANWQLKQGLKPDGVIGPNTWQRMKNMLVIDAKDPDIVEKSSKLSGNLDNITRERLGTLTIDSSKGMNLKPFQYSFSVEDVTWTAKFIMGEAGGRDDIDNRAVIWAMFNRYALFTNKYYNSFHKFIRAYSTPLQPVLKSPGAAARHFQKKEYLKTGGYYDPPYNYIPKGLLVRHKKLQEKRWNELTNESRNLAVLALKGLIPNPIGNATEFASTRVYYIQAHKREPTDDEWLRYTEAFAVKKNWKWIGPVSVLNQKKNAFFIQKRRLTAKSALLTDINFDLVKIV